MAELYCGDAACKARVVMEPGAQLPVVCRSCGACLFPEQELATRPRNEREAKRALLMRAEGDRRVAVASAAELSGASPEPAVSDDDTSDRIDALLDRVGPEPQRFGSNANLVMTLIVVALLIAGLLVWRLR